jgi:hypothetical protein
MRPPVFLHVGGCGEEKELLSKPVTGRWELRARTFIRLISQVDYRSAQKARQSAGVRKMCIGNAPAAKKEGHPGTGPRGR